jgi:hypothetical protein
VFNKSYHARARRGGGMVSAGAVLEELVQRTADRRRQERKTRRSGQPQDLQLELNFTPDETPEQMFDRLFP